MSMSRQPENSAKNVGFWWLKAILQNTFYEIDILEIGEHHDRKRGKGPENRQLTLLVLPTSEDNEYPQYIKLHALLDYRDEPI